MAWGPLNYLLLLHITYYMRLLDYILSSLHVLDGTVDLLSLGRLSGVTGWLGGVSGRLLGLSDKRFLLGKSGTLVVLVDERWVGSSGNTGSNGASTSSCDGNYIIVLARLDVGLSSQRGKLALSLGIVGVVLTSQPLLHV
jgi:hypothetical protein